MVAPASELKGGSQASGPGVLEASEAAAPADHHHSPVLPPDLQDLDDLQAQNHLHHELREWAIALHGRPICVVMRSFSKISEFVQFGEK